MGVHLREEEGAYLAGLRPNGDPYDWAGAYFSLFGGFVALLGFGNGWSLRNDWSRTAWLYILSALLVTLIGAYAYWQAATMSYLLLIWGLYIVSNVWLNTYLIFQTNRTKTKE